MKKIVFILTIITLLTSCKDKKSILLPNISGVAGEVVVVLNANLHHTALRDTIQNVLTEEYPMLPQQEPWFKPLIISENAFSTLIQRHRNILLIKIGPDYSQPKLSFQTDKWAKTQCIITASAPNKEILADYISEHGARIREVIEQSEINRNIAYYHKYEEVSLRQKIEKTFGSSMNFPDGYKIRKATDNFLWISLETPKTSQGIFIYSYPFIKQKIDGYYLLQKRNEFLKLNVPGSFPNTYMVTSEAVTPEIKKVQQNVKDGLSLIQIQGLWEVHNDFMGGPFVSQTLLDTLNFRIITLEAYVYAPKENKRNLLRQAYSVLRTFKLNTSN